jgi:hypothetical protein
LVAAWVVWWFATAVVVTAKEFETQLPGVSRSVKMMTKALVEAIGVPPSCDVVVAQVGLWVGVSLLVSVSKLTARRVWRFASGAIAAPAAAARRERPMPPTRPHRRARRGEASIARSAST